MLAIYNVMITVLPGDLVDRFNAAKILGLTPKTLANWHWKRVGPPSFKVSGRRRYRLIDIEKLARGGDLASTEGQPSGFLSKFPDACSPAIASVDELVMSLTTGACSPLRPRTFRRSRGD